MLKMKKGARQGKSIVTASGLKLTPSQESFAQAYCNSTAKTFCNATESLASIKEWQGTRESLSMQASGMKRHPVIQARIREILEDAGFSDTEVDMEHLKVIKQDKDLSNKMKGIIEYNRLKQRGAQQGQAVTVNIVNYADILNGVPDPIPLRPDEEAVSVTDLGERGEE